jgi:ABC-2 type transport system permease protein
MNIYLHELKSYRKNMLIWILSLSAGVFFMFSVYPAFSGNAAAIGDALKNYPLMIQLAFGLYVDQIGSINGFYSFIVTFLTLVGAVQAMTLGLHVLSKEATGRTADFLLTKPVARGRVAAAKFLAVFTVIAVTSAAYIALASILAAGVAGAPFNHRTFFLMSMTFFFVQTMFLSLGFLVAAVARKIRSVLPVAMSCVFALFALGTVAAMVEQEALYYLTPFKYFETYYILMTSSYKPSFTLAAALVTAGFVIAGFLVFIRRDVHAS